MKNLNSISFIVLFAILILGVSCKEKCPSKPTGVALQIFCSIDQPTVNDLDAVGLGLRWYAEVSGGNPLDGTVQLVDGQSYFVSQSNEDCESNRFEVEVKIKDVDLPIVSTPQILCGLDLPTVSDLEATGTELKWYSSSNGGSALDASTQLANGVSYYVSQTISDCESERVEVVVELGTEINTPTGQTEWLFYNTVSTAKFSDMILDHSSIKWYSEETGGTEYQLSEDIPNGQNTFYAASFNGCESDQRLEVNVIVRSIPSNGLLLFYNFENDANDISGNGYHGTSNATSSDAEDGITKALDFNGTDQLIDMPETSELEPQLPISFNFKVKFDDLDPVNSTIFTTDYEENNHSGVWMGLSSTGYFYVSIGNAQGIFSSTRRTYVGTTAIVTQKWYNVTAVVNGFDDIKIYLDGIEEGGTYSGSGTTLVYTDGNGKIGVKDGHAALDPYFFKGSLDEFGYWDRALNTSEISDLNY